MFHEKIYIVSTGYFERLAAVVDDDVDRLVVFAVAPDAVVAVIVSAVHTIFSIFEAVLLLLLILFFYVIGV